VGYVNGKLRHNTHRIQLASIIFHLKYDISLVESTLGAYHLLLNRHQNHKNYIFNLADLIFPSASPPQIDFATNPFLQCASPANINNAFQNIVI